MYIEACESGSMFDGILREDRNGKCHFYFSYKTITNYQLKEKYILEFM